MVEVVLPSLRSDAEEVERYARILEAVPTGVSHQLAPGDVVLLLTDGLLEAMSPDGDCFGAERLLDIFSANRAKPAAEIITAIYRALQRFSGGVPLVDGVTLVVAKVDPTSATEYRD